MISFLASLAEISSPIKVMKDGMRIAIDVPETELPNAVKIMNMRSKRLKVTIEEAR